MTTRAHCDSEELLGLKCGASTDSRPLDAGWIPLNTRRDGRWCHLCPKHSDRAADARMALIELEKS